MTAVFALDTYTLTYTAGANGTITGSSPQTVGYSLSGTAVTAEPNAGYHFVNWSDGSTDATRTDTNVTADKS
ncbi:InlB B-repeat-containing protein, partial [Paenibacillus ferrarius]|uniref:InlB B-repeat-containing protein n=1 Tax=Paenibacillus ferrarius TaxID=1469647 RepID=UPI003D275B39